MSEAPIKEVHARINAESATSGRLDAISGIASGPSFPMIRVDPLARASAIGLASPSPEQLAVLSHDSILGVHLESGGNALAIGLMGARSTGLAFTSDLRFDLTPELIGDDDDERLALDLIHPTLIGTGFSPVHFAVTVDGVARVERDFSMAADALAFFDDNRIDLAELNGNSGIPSKIELAFDVAAPNGTGSLFFSFQFALLTVPEPGLLFLLLLATVGVVSSRTLLQR
jgi:hypothetical protein